MKRKGSHGFPFHGDHDMAHLGVDPWVKFSFSFESAYTNLLFTHKLAELQRSTMKK